MRMSRSMFILSFPKSCSRYLGPGIAVGSYTQIPDLILFDVLALSFGVICELYSYSLLIMTMVVKGTKGTCL